VRRREGAKELKAGREKNEITSNKKKKKEKKNKRGKNEKERKNKNKNTKIKAHLCHQLIHFLKIQLLFGCSLRHGRQFSLLFEHEMLDVLVVASTKVVVHIISKRSTKRASSCLVWTRERHHLCLCVEFGQLPGVFVFNCPTPFKQSQ
jgi:hypothetical protein